MTATTTATPAAGRSQRFFLTLASVLATTLISIDIMIASVALPQMQGSLSATADQVAWVLTSYVITLAVMTPLVGPLTARLGRRRAFLWTVGGFTVASVLCGLAWSLESLVLFRLLQGACGAALVPIAQAVLLDCYPPERQGQAMAYWTAAVMVGPVVGPALGGWLTDEFSWHWIFLFNLPFGVLALVCVSAFMPPDGPGEPRRFDRRGFVLLALALGSLQFVLDRGEHLDWFDSATIVTWSLVSLGAGWMYLVHVQHAQHSFIPRGLLHDRNYLASLIITGVTSGVFMANIALFAPMLQNVLGYPAREAGLMVGPRGLGVMAGVVAANLLRRWFPDPAVTAIGLVAAAAAIWWMSTFSLDVDPRLVLQVGVTQGFWYGVMFVPLTTVTFATLAPQLRTDGAALVQLLRQLCGSAGIAVCFAQLSRRTEGGTQELAARLNADADGWWTLLAGHGEQGIALLRAELTRQAAMIAFVEVTAWLAVALLATVPLTLLFRTRRLSPAAWSPPVE